MPIIKPAVAIDRREAYFLLQMVLDTLESICQSAVIHKDRLDLLEKAQAQFDYYPELQVCQEVGKKLVKEYNLDA